MATVAVVGDRLLRLPMAVETRSVIRRNSLEGCSAGRVADRAVVVTLRRVRESQQRNYILMPIMRKLDRELPL